MNERLRRHRNRLINYTTTRAVQSADCMKSKAGLLDRLLSIIKDRGYRYMDHNVACGTKSRIAAADVKVASIPSQANAELSGHSVATARLCPKSLHGNRSATCALGPTINPY